MHVTRIGLTPLKGGRHSSLDGVQLTTEGPVGDRVFCLVDRAADRVMRTVENPSLVQVVAEWNGRALRATFPGVVVEASPAATGETVKVDYWGRTAALEVVDGPWAAAYARHLGRDEADLVLARASHPGEVVYGAPVSIVTTSSLDLLRDRSGSDVDSAQFRATFTVDTGGSAAHVEDGWLGSRIRIGAAVVEVRSVTPRCAVVDLDPATGRRRSTVLRALGDYRRARGQVGFGVDAVVVAPGRVRVEDRVGRG